MCSSDLGLERWRGLMAALPHPELARLILEESGYVAMLQADRSPEAPGRLDNLQELTRAMEEFDGLAAFLDHVALVMDNDQAVEGGRVTLMTLHAAKGLEFPYVFLPGWEEGVFPSQRALDEGGQAALEEERRLAYVGLTRARRCAWVLHAANRRVYGQWQSSIPSRFVEELPDEHVTRETTLTGGASLWRAHLGGGDDPFAHVARGAGRGPGWARASAAGGAMVEGTARRVDPPVRRAATAFAAGARVFHDKFGYGRVEATDGEKLTVSFDTGGRKLVMAGYVTAA